MAALEENYPFYFLKNDLFFNFTISPIGVLLAGIHVDR
jgi:hypothetical protein